MKCGNDLPLCWRERWTQRRQPQTHKMSHRPGASSWEGDKQEKDRRGIRRRDQRTWWMISVRWSIRMTLWSYLNSLQLMKTCYWLIILASCVWIAWECNTMLHDSNMTSHQLDLAENKMWRKWFYRFLKICGFTSWICFCNWRKYVVIYISFFPAIFLLTRSWMEKNTRICNPAWSSRKNNARVFFLRDGYRLFS